MADELGTYLMVLVLGLLSVLVVGQVLVRTGQAILEEAFTDRGVARSVNRLLGVLFHLGALGLLALIAIVDVPGSSPVQIVVTKLGIMLLVLGAAHGLVIMLLARIRNRNREQDALDRMGVQYRTPRPSVTPTEPAGPPTVIGTGPR